MPPVGDTLVESVVGPAPTASGVVVAYSGPPMLSVASGDEVVALVSLDSTGVSLRRAPPLLVAMAPGTMVLSEIFWPSFSVGVGVASESESEGGELSGEAVSDYICQFRLSLSSPYHCMSSFLLVYPESLMMVVI